MLPLASRATAPMVPWPGFFQPPSGSALVSANIARRSSVTKKSLSTSSMPHETSCSSVGSAKSTCGVCSMMARATSMGWRAVVRPVAAPVLPSPNMTQESSSALPSEVRAAPTPALNSGASSMTCRAAITASMAGSPACSFAMPASRARRMAASARACFSGGSSRRRLPAPPWITSRGSVSPQPVVSTMMGLSAMGVVSLGLVGVRKPGRSSSPKGAPGDTATV